MQPGQALKGIAGFSGEPSFRGTLSKLLENFARFGRGNPFQRFHRAKALQPLRCPSRLLDFLQKKVADPISIRG
jgi:hypothetical protein